MSLDAEKLNDIQQVLAHWRFPRPAMELSDREIVQTPGCLGKYLMSEVEELVYEIDQRVDRAALYAELIDILIFLLISFRVTGFHPDLSLQTNAPKTSGELHHKVMILMTECQQMMVGVKPAQLEQMFFVWRELAEHFSLEDSLSMLVLSKLSVNGWNRPAEYYQVQDRDGKRLTEEEIYKKFQHVEKCLKLIRNFFAQVLGKNTPLYNWMHQPFSLLILDFNNSQTAFILLEHRLQNSQPIYFQMLQNILQSRQLADFSDQELQDLANAAGGINIPIPS